MRSSRFLCGCVVALKRSFLYQTVRYSTNTPAKVVQHKKVEVPSFGKLVVKTPCNVDITSLTPEECIDQNKVILEVTIPGTVLEEPQVELLVGSKGVLIDGNDAEDLTEDSICHIRLPVKYDLDIESGMGHSVNISKMENESINVKMKDGSFCGCDLKSENIEVDSSEGDIKLTGRINGNIQLQTRGSGKIEGEMIYSSSIQLESENGCIKLGDVYADKSEISSKGGGINVSSLHGNTLMAAGDEGCVNIASFDGNLEVDTDKGHINIHANRIVDGCILKSKKGNITFRMDPGIRSSISAKGSVVDMDSSMSGTKEEGNIYKATIGKCENEEKLPTVNLTASQGTITVALKDWLSSLNLGKLAA